MKVLLSIVKTKLVLKDQRFGMLVVVKDFGKKKLLGGRTRVLRECLCDCGNTCYAPSDALIKGERISCGCERLRRAIESRATHRQTFGGRSTTEYSSWTGMIGRCENPKHPKWPKYGGRGIKVCERWRNDFNAFLQDMGKRPKGLTLDRGDNNGNYDPDNCEWRSRKDQQRNQTVTRFTTFHGKKVPVCELAENNGILTDTFCYHLDKGRTSEQIVEFLRRKRSGEKIKWKKFISESDSSPC